MHLAGKALLCLGLSDTGTSKEEGKTNHRRENREVNGEKSGF